MQLPFGLTTSTSGRLHNICTLFSVCDTEGTSLSTKMKEILDTHSKHFTHLWEGFMCSKQTPRLEPLSRANESNAACLFLVFEHPLHLLLFNPPYLFCSAITLSYVTSLSEMEQLLCKCSAFIYLGRERFMANIPPAKLAALSLSGTVHPYTALSLHGL